VKEDVPRRLYDMVKGPFWRGRRVVGGFLYGVGEECTWLNGTLSDAPFLAQVRNLNSDPAAGSSSSMMLQRQCVEGGRFRRWLQGKVLL